MISARFNLRTGYYLPRWTFFQLFLVKLYGYLKRPKKPKKSLGMAKSICIYESISKGPKEAPGHVKTPNGQTGIRPSPEKKGI